MRLASSYTPDSTHPSITGQFGVHHEEEVLPGLVHALERGTHVLKQETDVAKLQSQVLQLVGPHCH